MIRVFVAKNDTLFSPSQLDVLSSRLSPQLVSSAARYKRWQDAQAFLWGRYLLSEGLAHSGLRKNALQDLCFTSYKRPYLPSAPDFNISHSGEYIVCALGTGRVGIDIEQVRPVELKDFTGCFSAAELSVINNAPDVYQQFFTYWTVKEAVIKADGRGLSIPLETITVSDTIVTDQDTWFIHRLDIAPGYQSHLATDEASGRISIEQLLLPAG